MSRMAKQVSVEQALGLLCKKALDTSTEPHLLLGRTIKIRSGKMTAFSRIKSIVGKMDNLRQGEMTVVIDPVITPMTVEEYSDPAAAAKLEQKDGKSYSVLIEKINTYSFSELFFDFEKNAWTISLQVWPMSDLMSVLEGHIALNLKKIGQPHPIQPLLEEMGSKIALLPLKLTTKVGVVLMD